jgi:hypothetical protein
VVQSGIKAVALQHPDSFFRVMASITKPPKGAIRIYTFDSNEPVRLFQTDLDKNIVDTVRLTMLLLNFFNTISSEVRNHICRVQKLFHDWVLVLMAKHSTYNTKVVNKIKTQ